MRIALISDIHGNRWALDAVLNHIASQRVAEIWNLGDILSGPLEPAATADILMPLALPTICGNTERELLACAERPGGASDQYAFTHTDSRHHAWLRELPATLTPRDGVTLCHGSPRSDLEPLLETIVLDRQRPAVLAEIETRLDGEPALLVACGHTHTPRVVRTRSGQLIVNPGSVGLQAYDDDAPARYYVETGSPHASYATIEDVDGTWEVSFHRVAYDWGAAAACAERNGRTEWAYALRTGFALRW